MCRGDNQQCLRLASLIWSVCSSRCCIHIPYRAPCARGAPPAVIPSRGPGSQVVEARCSATPFSSCRELVSSGMDDLLHRVGIVQVGSNLSMWAHECLGKTVCVSDSGNQLHLYMVFKYTFVPKIRFVSVCFSHVPSYFCPLPCCIAAFHYWSNSTIHSSFKFIPWTWIVYIFIYFCIVILLRVSTGRGLLVLPRSLQAWLSWIFLLLLIYSVSFTICQSVCLHWIPLLSFLSYTVIGGFLLAMSTSCSRSD